MLNYFEEKSTLMSLNQVICLFNKRFLWKVKKIRRLITEEKMEKTKAPKKVNIELFIVE